MIASNDRGSQIDGGWMFFPAWARSCAGPCLFVHTQPRRGADEQERIYLGGRFTAMGGRRHSGYAPQ
eukprot:6571053-Lingulodinium_polyedra.AAC.1